jgi:adenylate cyclase
MTLFNELTRRKVFKVGAAYLVVAWLAVQAASIAFPAFEAPGWALRIFILIALLGFPISLVFAWAFDMTPDGLKSETGPRSSKIIFAIVAVLVVLAFAWYFKGQPTYREPADTIAAADDQNAVSTPAVIGKNSIAVMPFVNMSSDKEQEYFSDGMTEELLNVLAKMPQLKVVARTSVFEFKDKGGDIRDIGRKLGVAYIIEGSVRRDGQQVRVTAQLVRVSDGFHVWSETYDRKLESVFALQDEIAQQIGESLKVSLGVGTPISARAAIDPAAYDEYLKGRALLRARKDLPAAIMHFKAATQKAPDFSAAWSSLSLACEASFSYMNMSPDEQANMLACQSDAAQRAATLEPDSAASEHALGNVARSRFRYAEAERHYLRAMQIDPGYPDALEDYSELLLQVGRIEDSKRAAQQLVALDPYFIVAWNRMRDVALAQDNKAEIVALTQKLRTMFPESRLGKLLPITYALIYDRAAEARMALVDLKAQWPEYAKVHEVLLPWALGDPGVDISTVRAAIENAPPGEATNYLIMRRDVPGYTNYIEKAGAPSQGYYFARLDRSRPAGHAMLRDPLAKAKLVEYGFVDYWREKGWPSLCRPLGANDFECGVEAKK